MEGGGRGWGLKGGGVLEGGGEWIEGGMRESVCGFGTLDAIVRWLRVLCRVSGVKMFGGSFLKKGRGRLWGTIVLLNGNVDGIYSYVM